jgi:hypothetical protein
MDLLNSCNLLNYFGKAERVDDIELYPILIRKGQTKLALYGLGNIRDERLHRTFKANKVKWCVCPAGMRNGWLTCAFAVLLWTGSSRLRTRTTGSISQSSIRTGALGLRSCCG